MDSLHVLESVLAGDTREKLQYLDNLARICRSQLQNEYLSDGNIKELEDSYARLQLEVCELALQIQDILMAMNALDNIIIASGPRKEVLEKAQRIQVTNHLIIERYNSKWQVPPGTMALEKIHEGNIIQKSKAVKSTRNPSMVTFWESQGTPLLLEGCLDDWEAIGLWTPSYFTKSFGHRLVPVEIGKSYLDPDWKQEIMPFGRFIESLVNDSTDIVYVAQHDLPSQIPELLAHIRIPNLISTQSANVLTNFWFGKVGTITPLHTDPYDNFLCQIYGYKRVFLVDPTYSTKLPLDRDSSNTSTIDFKNVEALTKLNIPIYETIINPGEILYIPSGWWHAVIGLSASISISLWF